MTEQEYLDDHKDLLREILGSTKELRFNVNHVEHLITLKLFEHIASLSDPNADEYLLKQEHKRLISLARDLKPAVDYYFERLTQALDRSQMLFEVIESNNFYYIRQHVPDQSNWWSRYKQRISAIWRSIQPRH